MVVIHHPMEFLHERWIEGVEAGIGREKWKEVEQNRQLRQRRCTGKLAELSGQGTNPQGSIIALFLGAGQPLLHGHTMVGLS
jgi:hypothetical protein